MRRLALALFLAVTASAAQAAPRKAAPASPEVRGLSSSDPAVVRESIESLGMEGTRVAAEAITARLALGLDRELTLVALDALGILQHKPASEVVAPLARHRDATVRLRAVQTLIALEPKDARETLERGLDDLDPRVRAECARALARLGNRGSLPVLFRALDAGQLEAALAIAAHGDEAAIRKLATYLGRVPFAAMTEALAQVLGRADLERRLRLDVVSRLVELATPEVKYFFEDVADSLPGSADDPVKRAVRDAAFRIVD
jgi:HEAT repeat protein